jgi:hypothetical protein
LSEFKGLLNKLLEQKSDLTIGEIEEKLKRKKKKLEPDI